jgi:hypothetical protein
MNTPIVADESVDYAIIQLLRDAGFSVLAVVEEHSGWSDAHVLELAFRSNAYLSSRKTKILANSPTVYAGPVMASSWSE